MHWRTKNGAYSFWLKMVHELSEGVLYPLRTLTGQYTDHIVAVRPMVKLVSKRNLTSLLNERYDFIITISACPS